MLSGLPGVMNLAAASGENLGTVSDIVTDAMTAFGLSADKAGHFADVLAQASSKSNTNVGMMGETFKYVAPVAGALGYSAEDAAVADRPDGEQRYQGQPGRHRAALHSFAPCKADRRSGSRDGRPRHIADG